jgi:uncharacterized protein YndB with AHSA1/START domain
LTPTHDSGETLVIRRVLAVPRERVFAAWLDPVSLARWMGTGEGADVTALDPRVGGQFRVVMRHGGGRVEHWGEYLAIERPSFLSFTWVSANTEHRPTHVTVELLDQGDSTELILTHRRLPLRQVEPHRSGWTAILAALERTLSAAPPPLERDR